jgi:hypothetical protein
MESCRTRRNRRRPVPRRPSKVVSRVPRGWAPRSCGTPAHSSRDRRRSSPAPRPNSVLASGGSKIGPSRRDARNVHHNQPQNSTNQNAIRPGVDKSGDRAAALATEQRRAICISIFKIDCNCSGIGNDPIAIEQYRHTTLLRERDHTLVGKPPRNGIELQTLVLERHLDAPALRAEAAFRFRSGQIEEL